ncbi:hypothetical protein [Kutzneria buriramensis]|uniref:Uncharacterized protein n=1 Tax=Kutzneria buriramensis TaxID=1045776 RepID=A0A3E0GXL7_9PSEU|nr:hypothetical protein [Kutzneria buriramensis]REH32592.1 hypothetical protein BCF44_121141 [Kutzneria buriramensis]
MTELWVNLVWPLLGAAALTVRVRRRRAVRFRLTVQISNDGPEAGTW